MGIENCDAFLHNDNLGVVEIVCWALVDDIFGVEVCNRLS
jgi:hypothetical protein